MSDPNDGVGDGDELEVIEPYTSIAAVWRVLEMGKWGVTPRHGVKQTKTADLRGDKPFGDTGDCKASIRALHQMHHAALVRHPIAVLYQRLLSCPHILHIPLPPQLLVTKGKELRKPHKMEQLTTTIVIYIVLSMIHYAPDVRHAAIYFSRLISQSLARTKLGTEVLDRNTSTAEIQVLRWHARNRGHGEGDGRYVQEPNDGACDNTWLGACEISGG